MSSENEVSPIAFDSINDVDAVFATLAAHVEHQIDQLCAHNKDSAFRAQVEQYVTEVRLAPLLYTQY